MNDAEQHRDVGSASFQFCHRRAGSCTRIAFNLKVGDNPDFWRARLLMPGAEFTGIICAVFETDDGAVSKIADQEFRAVLYAGRSRFVITLFAEYEEEARAMCLEIGGFRLLYDECPTRWQRANLVLRFFWARRPVVRWRSPLDVFNS